MTLPMALQEELCDKEEAAARKGERNSIHGFREASQIMILDEEE